MSQVCGVRLSQRHAKNISLPSCQRTLGSVQDGAINWTVPTSQSEAPKVHVRRHCFLQQSRLRLNTHQLENGTSLYGASHFDRYSREANCLATLIPLSRCFVRAIATIADPLTKAPEPPLADSPH